MFITKAEYRCPTTNLFGGVNDSYWHAAEVTLATPWFIVTLMQCFKPHKSDGGQREFDCTRTLLIADVQNLLTILEEPTERTVFDSVLAVTPPYTNGSSEWQMSRVVAIWETIEKLDGQESDLRVPIIETADGKIFPTIPTEENIESKRLELRIRLPAKES